MVRALLVTLAYASIDAMPDGSPRTEKEVIVHRYGLLDPFDWAEDCEAELERMHALKNRLVKIECEYRDNFDCLLEQDLHLKERRQALEEHIETLTELGEAGTETTSAKSPLHKSRHDRLHSIPSAGLVAHKKDVAQAYMAARKRFKEELNNLELYRREQVKEARQQSGLWWGNYNAIINAFEQGRRESVRTRGVMRIKPFDGTGRFTNQIQDGLSVEALLAGKSNQVKVAPLPTDAWSHSSRGERRRRQRTQLTATIFVRDGQRRTVTWPMIMHRPLPEGSLIKKVVVLRSRLDDRWMWSVVFICTSRRPIEDQSITSGAVVAIDPGWRRTKTGLRVATIVWATGQTEYFELPNQLIQRFRFADELRDKQNLLLASLRKLISELNAHQHVEGSIAGEANINSETMRLPSEFRRLAKRLGSDPSLNASIVDQINRTSAEYKKLYLWERNHTRKILGHRDKLYQKLAVRTLNGASLALLHNINISEIAKRDQEGIMKGFVPNASKWYRATASTSSLKHWIENKAKRLGVPLKRLETMSNQLCPSCGASDRKNRADDLIYVCASCNNKWDRDWGTCQMMIKSHRAVY